MKKILYILLLLILVSCNKDLPCSGNCADIQISGKVIDTATNTGIPNVSLNVYWETAGMCFFCSTTKVTSHKTNSKGEFNFYANVDKSKFAYNYLRIAVSVPNGYINYHANTDEINLCSISRYEPDIKDLKVVMYPKTNLTIKLINTQNEKYNLFESYYKYGPTTSIRIYDKWGILNDTSLNVVTAANIYTKIRWRKVYSPGVWKFFYDSIKCSPATNNVFILNY